MRPSAPGVAVTNCAWGAAPAVVAGRAIPIKNKSTIAETKNKKKLNFIGADYIRIEIALGRILAGTAARHASRKMAA
jgi:hypothetical protein